MLKFWKKSENNLNCKKSSNSAKTVNFQEEVTVFQSNSAENEIKTQISIQTKAPRKFKLFSIIKWRSKKRKRKNKNYSSVKRKTSSKRRKKDKKGKKLALSTNILNF